MGTTDEHDPYGIVPPEFMERWATDTGSVADALRRAERAPSTTPESERKRCPFCGSRQVAVKSRKREGQHRKAGKLKCEHQGCRRHFDKTADETTIFMSNKRTDAFDWVEPTDTTDPDERGDSPLFATLDERTRTALAIVLYRPWTDAGPTLRELGKLFPNSRYWVGERNREWKAGEHRELVADPTAADVEPITVDESSGPDAIAADGGERRSRWAAYGGMD